MGKSSANLKIVMAQINSLVGDIRGNAQIIIELACRARDHMGAAVIVFPELALTGYPPEDLLLRPALSLRVLAALEQIMQKTRGIDVVLGFPHAVRGGLYNAAGLLREGKLHAVYHKHHLPNYSVFDEKRYFTPGDEPCVVDIQGIPVGLTVCEDIWSPGPVQLATQAGAKFILNINASPFHINKGIEREEVVRQHVRESSVPVLYVNLVGGQDELVFDGASFVMDAAGQVVVQAPAFSDGLYPLDLGYDGSRVTITPQALTPPLSEDAAVYQALVTGVRDYIGKNGFKGAVLGLSGGIDSALTLAIAVDAIGADKVEAVSMPSRYTADMSVDDARIEAERLGVKFSVIPIEPAYETFLTLLRDEFAGAPTDTTEENMQARCRGLLLMAISNKKRQIVLTTGNKSEMAVGYATLYGDMAGGYDVLKDVPKTLVFRLAHYRNTLAGEVIPARVISRPPSAELAPDQKDTDSLPPYAVLDPILELYVEQDKEVDEIVAAGFEREMVKHVVAMVDRNEYKRRQAPPGIRITRRAFGRDRRYPITSGYGKG